MNFTDFVTGLRGAAAAAMLAVITLAAPDPAAAQNAEVTVEQVRPGTGGDTAGYYQDTTGAGDDTGDYVPTQLITGGARLTVGSTNLSSINQAGNSNFASVNISGIGNEDPFAAFLTGTKELELNVDAEGRAQEIINFRRNTCMCYIACL